MLYHSPVESLRKCQFKCDKMLFKGRQGNSAYFKIVFLITDLFPSPYDKILEIQDFNDKPVLYWEIKSVLNRLNTCTRSSSEKKTNSFISRPCLGIIYSVNPKINRSQKLEFFFQVLPYIAKVMDCLRYRLTS